MRRDDLCHPVRERLARLPAPFDSHYGVIPLPPPEEGIVLGSARLAHQKAIKALARIKTVADEFDDPYIVSRLLARREAVSSSSIEGTNSTLDELLSLEEGAGEAARDAALQVRDYALTLDRFVPRARTQGATIFTTQLLSELHREAMRSDGAYADIPGELRSRVVWIGGIHDIAYSTYNPTPPDRIAECLEDNASYMRGEGMQVAHQSIVARLAVAHAHFEAVHPFRDGNGRVGRLLLPLMMAADGEVPLYLSPYIEANKAAYYASLKAAQQQLNWDAAIDFVSDAISGTVEELMATRDALRALADLWRSRRRYRDKSAGLRALPLLLNYPVISAKRLAERLGISAPSANEAISQLVDAGILQERTGYRRNRIFAATEVLTILNRPFGAEPIVGASSANAATY